MRLVVAGVLLCAVVAAEEPVRRHVLALIEGSRPHPHNEDVVHALLELPLNHLGMVVRRHYIENGPPPAAWLEDARAVLTYFTAAGKPQAWLWPWLERNARNLRVIHFGDLGPLEGEKLAPWLKRFGLEQDGTFVQGPFGIDVEYFDERACSYEASPRSLAHHRGPRSTRKENKVWVTTRADGDVRTPVVTGPWGGIALDPWTLRAGTRDQDRRWHLDPFLFFKEALGLERVPAPHPSVLNGRRMWFLQVDGDGFESLSTVRPGSYAARVMLDEVFKRYRLPYTVSVIVRSLTPDYAIGKETRAMQLAREILNLPHVEAASHGVLHTLLWQVDLRPAHEPKTVMWYPSLKNYTYNQVAEVRDSIRFINERLLPGGRKCEVMLWTGHANPREGPIRAAREAGSLNLNGGVFRWDRWSDSVGFVSPWSRRVGRELQVYAGAANENDFGGFFTTMPGSFAHVDETIERTGSPRILKPANLYIHFYSAERPARLKTIHDLIRKWAFEKPTAPVHASTYARAVRSAVLTAKVFRTKQGWRFADFGGCRTARIDAEPREVDFEASTAILGARRIGTSLYIHLARPDAELVLARGPPRHPHVVEANCILEDARVGRDRIEVTATAHHRRKIVFGGLRPDENGADGGGRVTVELEPGTSRVVAGRQ